VSTQQLTNLPCDRDYLGTLGHLTRACLTLGALDYAEVLYRSLEPYSDAFAAHISFFCEGPVGQLLGMLSSALGKPARALVHLEVAISQCDNARLGLRGAEARLQYANLLAQQSTQRRRALAIAREAQASAQRMSLTRIASDAVRLIERLGDV
jgi:hypothetical protein